MLDEYIAHGELLLDDMLYSEDELYHWKLGFSMPNHKWIERLGTPGHYIYKYAEDLHEMLTGDKLKATAAELAKEHGRLARNAKTAAENYAAASVVANAIGKNGKADKYYKKAVENKETYDLESKRATIYSDIVEDINNLPINRLRRRVRGFVGETSANVQTLVAKGDEFLRRLFGKKKEPEKPKPSRPDRPHQRKKKVASGVAYVKKNEKVKWYEGWDSSVTGQQILDAASGKRQ